MKKIAFADMTKYGTPPKHVNVVSARFQGEAETGLKSFWMGMSHYLPGGGVEWSGEDSSEDKVYYVLEGELTVTGKDETFVLGPRDSLYIGPNEGRSIVNAGNAPATMLVIVNTLPKA
jgi:mannose-6-phosphate isomerase-like protein (cupin superfamily)